MKNKKHKYLDDKKKIDKWLLIKIICTSVFLLVGLGLLLLCCHLWGMTWATIFTHPMTYLIGLIVIAFAIFIWSKTPTDD